MAAYAIRRPHDTASVYVIALLCAECCTGTRAQRASTDAIAAAADMAKVAVLSSCAGDDRKALVWFARAIGHQASAGATQRDAGLLADARVVAIGVRCLLSQRQNGLACVLSCVSKPPLSRLAQRLIEESSSAAGLAATYRHVTDVGVLEWAVHWHNTRGENKERTQQCARTAWYGW